jgi:hypothetical protein
MTDTGETKIQRAVSVVASDMVPQSADHFARLLMGGAAVGAACWKYGSHVGAWTREDLIAAALFLLGGLGVMFTGSVVALIRAVPVPWRKNGNGGPPPPAEG